MLFMIHKERENFIDRLRVAATCAVVLLHTITGIMDITDMSTYGSEKTGFLVLLDLITWCVPVFVLISGYLFLDPAREISFGKMIRKYCRRILLALLVFGIPYAFIEMVLTERAVQFGMFKKALWMVCTGNTWSHMWYLYMILLLYVLTPALKKMLSAMSNMMIYTVLAFLLLGSSIFPFLNHMYGTDRLVHLPDGGIYFFYYIAGYLLAKRKPVSSEHKSTLQFMLFAVVSFLFTGMVASRLVGDYGVRMAYNYPFTVMASVLLFILFRRWEPYFQTKNPLHWKRAGELCFAIYLIHPIFLNLLYKGMHFELLKYPLRVYLPCVFLMVLLVSAVAAWVLRQISFLKKYVL